MNLHSFVVISEPMIQVPEIKIQHRSPLWRIYFPHYQTSKLNRKNEVKKLFLTCCQTNPIYFHCPSYRTSASVARGSCHILEEHTAGKEQSLRWLLGFNPHSRGGAKAATGSPPGESLAQLRPSPV